MGTPFRRDQLRVLRLTLQRRQTLLSKEAALRLAAVTPGPGAQRARLHCPQAVPAPRRHPGLRVPAGETRAAGPPWGSLALPSGTHTPSQMCRAEAQSGCSVFLPVCLLVRDRPPRNALTLKEISFQNKARNYRNEGFCLAANLPPKPPIETRKGRNNKKKKKVINSEPTIFSTSISKQQYHSNFFLL